MLHYFWLEQQPFFTPYYLRHRSVRSQAFVPQHCTLSLGPGAIVQEQPESNAPKHQALRMTDIQSRYIYAQPVHRLPYETQYYTVNKRMRPKACRDGRFIGEQKVLGAPSIIASSIRHIRV